MSNYTVYIELDAVDYNRGVNETLKKLNRINTQNRKINDTLKTQNTLLKDAAKTAAGLASAYAGFSAFKSLTMTGAAFEKQMVKNKVLLKASDSEFEKLTKTVRHLGATTSFSASQVGKAAEYLALSGMDVNKTIGALPGLLNLAKASGEDLATVADIVSDQLTALGLHSTEASRMSDSFAFAMSNANTTVYMLGEALKYVSPIMATAQQKMTTVVTSISLLSNIGIKASSAGTGLRMAMNRLVGPTSKGAKVLTKFGTVVEDSEGNVRDLADILIDLQTGSSKFTAAEKLESFKKLVGTEALPAILELVKQSKVMTQTINVMGQEVQINTTNFKKFRLEQRLAQKEGKMLALSLNFVGKELNQIEKHVDSYDKALNSQIVTGESLRSAFLSQGNGAHELVAAISTLEKQNVSTALSTDILTGFVENMMAPSEKASETFAKISESVGKPFDKINDFSVIIEHLGKVTEGLSKEEKLKTYLELVGDAGLEGAQGLSKLINASDQLESIGSDMTKVKGAASEMATEMSKNLSGDLTTLGSAFESLQISIFNTFGPTLRYLTQSLTSFVRMLDDSWKNSDNIVSDSLDLIATELKEFVDNVSLGNLSKFGYQLINDLIEGLKVGAKFLLETIDGIFTYILDIFNKSTLFKDISNELYKDSLLIFKPLMISVKNNIGELKNYFNKQFGILFGDIKLPSTNKILDDLKQFFNNVKEYVSNILTTTSFSEAFSIISTDLNKIVNEFRNSELLSVVHEFTIKIKESLVKGFWELISVLKYVVPPLLLLNPTIMTNVGSLSNFVAASSNVGVMLTSIASPLFSFIRSLGLLKATIFIIIPIISTLNDNGFDLLGTFNSLTTNLSTNLSSLDLTGFDNLKIVVDELSEFFGNLDILAKQLYENFKDFDNFLIGFSDSFINVVSGSEGLQIALLAATGAASLFLSPMLAIASVISLGVVGFTQYSDSIITTISAFSELSPAMQTGLEATAVVMGIGIYKLIRHLQAVRKAKECMNNPLLGCILPDKRELVKKIKQGKEGFQLAAKGALDGIGVNCDDNKCLKQLENQSKLTTLLASDAAKQHGRIIEGTYTKTITESQKTTEKTKNIFSRFGESIKSVFSSAFSFIRKDFEKTQNDFRSGIEKTQSYIQKARLTGSGVTDKRTAPIIDRASSMARERGISKYESEMTAGGRPTSTLKETEAFKRLKEEAVKEAQQTKTILQKMVTSVADFYDKTLDTTKKHTRSFIIKSQVMWGNFKKDPIKSIGKITESVKTNTLQALNSAKSSATSIAQTATTKISSVVAKASALISTYTNNTQKQFNKSLSEMEAKAAATHARMSTMGGPTMSTSGTVDTNNLLKAQNEFQKTSQVATKSLTEIGNQSEKTNGKIAGIGLGVIALGGMFATMGNEAQAFDEMGNKIEQQGGIIQTLNNGLTVLKDNWVSISLTVGPLLLTFMELTTVLKGLGIAAAGFVGYQIGTYLYNEFEIVRTAAQNTVGFFIETGAAIKDAFILVTPELKLIGSTIIEVFSTTTTKIGELVSSISSTVSTIHKTMVDGLSSAFNAIFSFDWKNAGSKIISMIGDGIISGATALRDKVKGVFSSIRDLSPFSEPKASDSPLRGLSKSGEAIMTNFIPGVQKGGRTLQKATKEQLEQVKYQITDLENRIETIGMDKVEKAVYDAKGMGASDEQIEQIKYLQTQFEWQSKLNQAKENALKVGKSEQQLENEHFLKLGISQLEIDTLREIEQQTIANNAFNKKMRELDLRLQSAGLTNYESELAALRRKGVAEEDVLRVEQKRLEILQKKADKADNTTLLNLQEELKLLKMSNKEREKYQFIQKNTSEHSSESSKQIIEGMYHQIENQKELNKLQEQSQKVWDEIGDNVSSFFDSVLDGSKSIKESFTDLTKSMRSMWTKTLGNMAQQQLQGLFQPQMAMAGGQGTVVAQQSGNSMGGDLIGGIGKALGNMDFTKGLDAIKSFDFGNITKSFTGLKDSLFGASKASGGLVGGLSGTTIAMGGLSAGMSLLNGDTAGAAQGIAQLAGSMTPLGPVGGMIAGQLTAMAGIGAKWAKSAEYMNLQMTGMVESFTKRRQEIKKSMFKKKKKTVDAELNQEELEMMESQANALREHASSIIATLGQATDDVTKKFSDFSISVEGSREDLKAKNFDPEQINKSIAQMQKNMITHALENVVIPTDEIEGLSTVGEKVSTLMNSRIESITSLFTTSMKGVDFDIHVADSRWKGDLKRVVGKFSEKGQKYQDILSGVFKDIIAETSEIELRSEDLTSVLTTKLRKTFSAIGVNDLPIETFENLANALNQQIKETLGALDTGSDETTKNQAEFYKGLIGISKEFQGSADELNTFVSNMMVTKDSMVELGISTKILDKNFMMSQQKMSLLSTGLNTFKDVVGDTQKKNINPLVETFKALGYEVPNTKQALVEFMQSSERTEQELLSLLPLTGHFEQYLRNSSDGILQFQFALQNLNESISATDIQEMLLGSKDGNDFANQVTSGIKSQITDAMYSSVATTIHNAIIQPMLQATTMQISSELEAVGVANAATTTGASTAAQILAGGGQAAKDYIDGIVNEVKDTLTVMKTIMENEEINAMFESMTPALTDIGNEFHQTFGTMSQTIQQLPSPSIDTTPVNESFDTTHEKLNEVTESNNDYNDSLNESLQTYDNFINDLKVFGNQSDANQKSMLDFMDKYKGSELAIQATSNSVVDFANQLTDLDVNGMRKIANSTNDITTAARELSSVSSEMSGNVVTTDLSDLLNQVPESLTDFKQRLSTTISGFENIGDDSNYKDAIEEKLTQLGQSFNNVNLDNIRSWELSELNSTLSGIENNLKSAQSSIEANKKAHNYYWDSLTKFSSELETKHGDLTQSGEQIIVGLTEQLINVARSKNVDGDQIDKFIQSIGQTSSNILDDIGSMSKQQIAGYIEVFKDVEKDIAKISFGGHDFTTALGTTQDGLFQFQKSIERVGNVSSKMNLEPIEKTTETLTENVNIVGDSIEELSQDTLNFLSAKQAIQDGINDTTASIFDMSTTLSEPEKIFKKISDSFSDMSGLDETQEKARNQFIEGFKSVFAGLDFSQSASKLTEMLNNLSPEKLIQFAESLGMSQEQLLSMSTQFLEAKKIEQDSFNERLEATTDFNESLKKQLLERNSSELELLEQDYRHQLDEANKLGANVNLVEQLYQSKRLEIIEEKENERLEALKAKEAAKLDFEKGLMDEKTELTKSKFDLELLALQNERDERIKQAKEHGSELHQIHEIFNLKESELYKSHFDSISKFQDSLTVQDYSVIENDLQKLGSTSEEVAQKIRSFSASDINAYAELRAVSHDTLIDIAKTHIKMLEDIEQANQRFSNKIKPQKQPTLKDMGLFIGLETGLESLEKQATNMIDFYAQLTNESTGISSQLQLVAKEHGQSYDSILNSVSTYITELQKQAKEYEKSLNIASEFTTSLGYMALGLDKNEETIDRTVKKYPKLELLNTSADNIIQSLLRMPSNKMVDLAKSFGTDINTFTKDMETYINALKASEKENNEVKLDSIQDHTKDVKEASNDLKTAYDSIIESITNVSQSVTNSINSLQGIDTKLNIEDVKVPISLESPDEIKEIIGQYDIIRQQIVDSTNAKIEGLEKEKDAAIKMYDDLVSSIGSLSQDIQKSIDSISPVVRTQNDLQRSFDTETDYTTKIELAGQLHAKINENMKLEIDKVKEASKTRIESIKENAKLQNEAAQKYRDSIKEIKGELENLGKSVGNDILSIQKDMGLVANTASKELAVMGSMSSVATKENIGLLDKRRSLIMESMKEQIEAEKERFNVAKEQHSSLLNFAKQLQGFMDSLKLDENLSTLTMSEMLSESRRQYSDVLKKAKAGDIEAQGELTNKMKGLLEMSSKFYAVGSDDYKRIFDEITNETEGLIDESKLKAAKIADEFPIDQTESGKNLGKIREIQENAISELQNIEAVMASMDSSLNESLNSDKAKLISEEEINALILAEENNTQLLIDGIKQDSMESLIGLQNSLKEVENAILLEKDEALSEFDTQILNAQLEGVAELQNINIKLGDIKSSFETLFNNTEPSSDTTLLNTTVQEKVGLPLQTLEQHSLTNQENKPAETENYFLQLSELLSTKNVELFAKLDELQAIKTEWRALDKETELLNRETDFNLATEKELRTVELKTLHHTEKQAALFDFKTMMFEQLGQLNTTVLVQSRDIISTLLITNETITHSSIMVIGAINSISTSIGGMMSTISNAISSSQVQSTELPKFHTGGIASNETYAILRKDEQVLDPDLSRKLQQNGIEVRTQNTSKKTEELLEKIAEILRVMVMSDSNSSNKVVEILESIESKTERNVDIVL